MTEHPEETQVTLTLPVSIQVLALDDPLIVPLTLSGTVSLSGATEVAVPVTTGPGLGILLAAMLVGAAWLRKAASGRS